MSDSIFKKVQNYIKEYDMLSHCSAIIVGVSGGPDSMVMLDILERISLEYGFRLHAVHINHGIRAQEALRDQKIVEDFCRSRKIPLQVYAYDVPRLSLERKKGEEETGREVRREAFFKEREILIKEFCTYTKKNPASDSSVRIALAHNKNDLAETMLHHLARGTGLRGLSPIKPVSGGIIRPVLCLERKEIENYVRKRGLPAVLDSTNLKDDYTRNRIRSKILPLLEQEVNPRAVEHMAETAVLLAQAEEFIAGRAQEQLLRCRQKNGGYFLDSEFALCEDILKSYAVREMLEDLAGAAKDLESVHIRKVLDLFEGRSGSRINLPCGIEAHRTYDGVLLQKKEESNHKFIQQEWVLEPGKCLECDLGTFQSKIFSWSEQKILQKKYTKWFDCDKIKAGLSVRTRRPGDYLVINGAGERKKLNRYMIDEKIPAVERDRVPLIVSGSEVLWAVGGRISENCKITSETVRVLEIRYMEPGGQQECKKQQR